jgi:hypothetical protein
MKKIAWLAPLLAVALYAGDISGRWVGVIEIADPSSGTTMNARVRAEFIQKASEISGRIGRAGDDQSEPIRNGRVEGDRVVFEVNPPETTGALKFDLKVVEGNHLEGTMNGAVDTGAITGKVKLTRDASK